MVIYRYSSGEGTFTMQHHWVLRIFTCMCTASHCWSRLERTLEVLSFTLLEHIRGVERIYWLGREGGLLQLMARLTGWELGWPHLLTTINIVIFELTVTISLPTDYNHSVLRQSWGKKYPNRLLCDNWTSSANHHRSVSSSLVKGRKAHTSATLFRNINKKIRR